MADQTQDYEVDGKVYTVPAGTSLADVTKYIQQQHVNERTGGKAGWQAVSGGFSDYEEPSRFQKTVKEMTHPSPEMQLGMDILPFATGAAEALANRTNVSPRGLVNRAVDEGSAALSRMKPSAAGIASAIRHPIRTTVGAIMDAAAGERPATPPPPDIGQIPWRIAQPQPPTGPQGPAVNLPGGGATSTAFSASPIPQTPPPTVHPPIRVMGTLKGLPPETPGGTALMRQGPQSMSALTASVPPHPGTGPITPTAPEFRLALPPKPPTPATTEQILEHGGHIGTYGSNMPGIMQPGTMPTEVVPAEATETTYGKADVLKPSKSSGKMSTLDKRITVKDENFLRNMFPGKSDEELKVLLNNDVNVQKAIMEERPLRQRRTVDAYYSRGAFRPE